MYSTRLRDNYKNRLENDLLYRFSCLLAVSGSLFLCQPTKTDSDVYQADEPLYVDPQLFVH
jgi:hypothetical protein